MYNRVIDKQWDFKSENTKEYTHCYHMYPAMMMPQIARELIKNYKPNGKCELIFDPYMGSGTTLVEASLAGINSVGTDINPLARFMSSVKTTNFDIDAILKCYQFLNKAFDEYNPDEVEDTDFTRISNYSFWYDKSTLLVLSYISQNIKQIPENLQNFFNVALSETVRDVSFTRKNEFKRYRMSEDKINKCKLTSDDVFLIFRKKIERNCKGLVDYNQITSNFNCKARICDFNSVYHIPSDILQDGDVDMVITSPPYGDSHTTVAYGQFSRWANEWFNFPNAKNLDNLLMGGNKKKEISVSTESIKSELDQIKTIDIKRYNEVMSFMDDYALSIHNVAKTVRNGGRICYVVGNRTVKGIQIPLDYFTAEMFEKSGFKHDITIVREIFSKRLPKKISSTGKSGETVDTMNNEYIVICTKNNI